MGFVIILIQNTDESIKSHLIAGSIDLNTTFHCQIFQTKHLLHYLLQPLVIIVAPLVYSKDRLAEMRM